MEDAMVLDNEDDDDDVNDEDVGTFSRGCTGEFSTKKMFSKLFFSQCNVVGMVCMMNTHQKNF
jgi:hypothetical protein